jgi:predicted nuclease of predicted toxin-antitoxin system
MKVLIDMNLSPDWTDFLTINRIESVHWSAIGKADAPDADIVEYALQFHYIVLTQDLDFGAILLATNARRPSVVQIRAGRVHPSSLGTQVLTALRELETDLHQGAFVTIEPERTRLRLLPFSEP